MNYSLAQIAQIVGGQCLGNEQLEVSQVFTDTRTEWSGANRLFVALKGLYHDGHDYIAEAKKNGTHCFLASSISIALNEESGAVVVPDTLVALQLLARHFRESLTKTQFVGITGSNGKTIVKEWLFRSVQSMGSIGKSPKSFNSQVGVPLSILRLAEGTNVALIEAGISQIQEMPNLQKMIQPDLGICTFLGSAHIENFDSQEAIAVEKCQLFEYAKAVIYPSSQPTWKKVLSTLDRKPKLLSWGAQPEDDFRFEHKPSPKGWGAILHYKGSQTALYSPMSDTAAVFNLCTTAAAACYLGVEGDILAKAIAALRPVNMRMEVLDGRHGGRLINDSYSSDLDSLQAALDLLQRQARPHRLILSDFVESVQEPPTYYPALLEELAKRKLDELILIGPQWLDYLNPLIGAKHYAKTQAFLDQLESHWPIGGCTLVKGARKYAFESIVLRLQGQDHETVLEINLANMLENLNTFRSALKPATKIMAMVKASGYGNGAEQVAALLEFHQIDYLAVAYADEGVALRQKGIHLPILVLNPDISSYHVMVDYKLEPEIYSFRLLESWAAFLKREAPANPPSIQIKIDTGMHRLGFSQQDLPALAAFLNANPHIKVAAVFSHLAAADEPVEDAFTQKQLAVFNSAVAELRRVVDQPFLSHIANTSGTARFPEAELDMVRLGIGLYGVGIGPKGEKLQPVSTLRSIISQIHSLEVGETVGYGRAGKITKPTRVATIPVGYADGLPRLLSNGAGSVVIRGKTCPILGKVCMDMIMVDLGDCPAEEGDSVEVFGHQQRIESFAEAAQTIPYEILTSISQRVKRVYLNAE